MSGSAQKDVDVLVVGGGVIGLCSAYYLLEQGREVVILEQGDIGAGSSYGNAGLIVPSHLIPLAEPGALAKGLKWLLDAESPFYIKPRLDRELLSWLWRFRAASREAPMRRAIPVLRDLGRISSQLYEELVARESLACNYEQLGLLTLFRSEDGYEEGAAEARLLQEFGMSLSLLSGAELREMEPALSVSVIGGIHYHRDAHLNPALFLQEMAKRVQRMGAAVQTHTEVLGFEVRHGRIHAVQSTRGDYFPEQVVLAAGSWSPTLARDLRLSLPVQPAKGYSVTVERPPTAPRFPLLLGEARVAVTPMESQLRFAGTLELAGLDFIINRRRVGAILRAATAYLEGQPEQSPLIEIWRGLRPCTPDGLPIIGRAASPRNLIVATGHATIGMSLGPVSGKLVAQITCDQPPLMDVTPLRVGRFSR